MRVVLAGFVLLWAAACAAEQAGTTLIFKHGKLAAAPGVMRAILAEFEAQHPGLLIKEELLPASTDQQHQYFAINLESREPPFDLMAVDVIWVQEFARAGWVRPLDDAPARIDADSHFAAAIEAATYRGRLFAAPWYVDAGVLFYRTDLLERYGLRPPATWPDLSEAAQTVLRGEQRADGRTLHGFIWPGRQSEGLVCVALEFIWSHGGTLLEPEAAVPATAYMRTLIDAGVSPPLVATADEENARLLFGDGRAVFMRNWPYAWRFLQQPGSAVAGKVGVAPLPAFPGHEPASVLGGWMLAVPHHAVHGDAALELAAYLTSAPVQRRMAATMQYSPSRPALYDTDDADTGAMRALLPVFARARPRPLTPYYLTVSHILQPAFSDIVVGRKRADASLAAARRQLAQLVAE